MPHPISAFTRSLIMRTGFLKIPITGIRPNVMNVYRLWCAAEGREFIVKGGPEA
jgi:hypothetical protein